jgi:hypothetical protein
MKPEYNIQDIAGPLRDMIINYVYATRSEDTERLPLTRQLLAELAIELLMGPDPYSGERPHEDTVECLAEGLLARIDVSNARPVAYKDDPWREQSEGYHADHALGHVRRALKSITHGELHTPWISDLGEPEAAHAAFRCDMLLWAHKKASKK